MLNPILVPLLAVDFHTLHKVATALVIEPIGRDAKRVIVVDSDVDVVKPWRDDEKDRLRGYRVEAQLLPNKP